MNWLGIDIGGANIKLADGAGFAVSRPFAIWRTPERLPAPRADALAVTMTGELADCYQTKREGVVEILQAARRAVGNRALNIYCTDGRFVTCDQALADPIAAAASNWHALASFAGRHAGQGSAMLLDIGSTTTDIIGLVDGLPHSSGTTDTERLASGELVYTGISRSPVAAISQTLPYRTKPCGVAQELFATTHDVYLTLGDIPEDAANCDTADGRPATCCAARARLARMICADTDVFDDADATAMARAVSQAQTDRILAAVAQVNNMLPAPPRAIVVSGSGEFLARRIADAVAGDAKVISLTDQLGPDVSTCAAAHAVAVLAGECLG